MNSKGHSVCHGERHSDGLARALEWNGILLRRGNPRTEDIYSCSQGCDGSAP